MRGNKGGIDIAHFLGFFSVLLLLLGSGLVIYGYYVSDTNLMGTGGIAVGFGFVFLITAMKIA